MLDISTVGLQCGAMNMTTVGRSVGDKRIGVGKISARELSADACFDINTLSFVGISSLENSPRGSYVHCRIR